MPPKMTKSAATPNAPRIDRFIRFVSLFNTESFRKSDYRPTGAAEYRARNVPIPTEHVYLNSPWVRSALPESKHTRNASKLAQTLGEFNRRSPRIDKLGARKTLVPLLSERLLELHSSRRKRLAKNLQMVDFKSNMVDDMTFRWDGSSRIVRPELGGIHAQPRARKQRSVPSIGK